MTKLQYAVMIANIWLVGYLAQSEKPLDKKILDYGSLFFSVLSIVLFFF